MKRRRREGVRRPKRAGQGTPDRGWVMDERWREQERKERNGAVERETARHWAGNT